MKISTLVFYKYKKLRVEVSKPGFNLVFFVVVFSPEQLLQDRCDVRDGRTSWSRSARPNSERVGVCEEFSEGDQTEMSHRSRG